MKVLMASTRFESLTGPEMYLYELSRELVAAGHHVGIISNPSGEIAERAAHNGVELLHFAQASLLNRRQPPDIVHLNQPEAAQEILSMLPAAPVVQTVHSEADWDSPVVDHRVKKYICIRQSIQRHLGSSHGIRKQSAQVICSPIDLSRFEPVPRWGTHRRKMVVFVGAIEQRRRASILHLIDRSTSEGFDLRIVGHRVEPYLDEVRLPNVQILPPMWNVERYLDCADETAGVLLGRTTLEGWACGKPGWVYDVDDLGEILSVRLEQPPGDMREFDSRVVAGKTVELYASVLGRSG